MQPDTQERAVLVTSFPRVSPSGTGSGAYDPEFPKTSKSWIELLEP